MRKKERLLEMYNSYENMKLFRLMVFNTGVQMEVIFFLDGVGGWGKDIQQTGSTKEKSEHHLSSIYCFIFNEKFTTTGREVHDQKRKN